jgi:hypothetical protein
MTRDGRSNKYIQPRINDFQNNNQTRLSVARPQLINEAPRPPRRSGLALTQNYFLKKNKYFNIQIITTATDRPPRGRTGHHRCLPGRVNVLIESNFLMIAILRGKLSNPLPFPLHRIPTSKTRMSGGANR